MKTLMSIEEMEGFEIPTATPILYRFRRSSKPLDWQYLDTVTPTDNWPDLCGVAWFFIQEQA